MTDVVADLTDVATDGAADPKEVHVPAHAEHRVKGSDHVNDNGTPRRACPDAARLQRP